MTYCDIFIIGDADYLVMKKIGNRRITTVEAVSSGQHEINRQQHNSTLTISSRCKIMLFYAFEMAVGIAFLQNHRKS